MNFGRIPNTRDRLNSIFRNNNLERGKYVLMLYTCCRNSMEDKTLFEKEMVSVYDNFDRALRTNKGRNYNCIHGTQFNIPVSKSREITCWDFEKIDNKGTEYGRTNLIFERE
jgi:hypothetical protein